jgi:hypothetical protein
MRRNGSIHTALLEIVLGVLRLGLTAKEMKIAFTGSARANYLRILDRDPRGELPFQYSCYG